ncbi:hypothetical protein HJG45_12865 [Roseicella sp. DB1501]|nr:hypothetical protein [Roseicella sp. DB1501]
MAGLGTKPIAMHPRGEGKRVLFEIVDSGHHVVRTISTMALEDLRHRRCCYKPADQLNSSALARRQIETIALGKIGRQVQDASGLLSIRSNDVDDLLSTSQRSIAGRRAKGCG